MLALARGAQRVACARAHGRIRALPVGRAEFGRAVGSRAVDVAARRRLATTSAGSTVRAAVDGAARRRRLATASALGSRAARRRLATEAGKDAPKEKPPSFHSEKPKLLDSARTTATRNADFPLADAIGLAGFGLLTFQWLMDDVLVLRCFGMASCGSMIFFNFLRKPPVMLPVLPRRADIPPTGRGAAATLDADDSVDTGLRAATPDVHSRDRRAAAPQVF